MKPIRTHRLLPLLTRAVLLVLTTLISSGRCGPGTTSSSRGHHFAHGHLSPLGREEHFGGGAVVGSGAAAGSGSGVVNGVGTSGGVVGNPTVAGGGGEVLIPKAFPLSAQEPTCEQLRAMWIFSKRQSRAAEMTNEIPTYRDPFAYNIWEPYYSMVRGGVGNHMTQRYGDRSRSPVFGRVISREPMVGPRLSLRQRHIGDRPTGIAGSGSPSRLYNSEGQAVSTGLIPRRQMQYRFGGAINTGSGGASDAGGHGPNSVGAQKGSFQKLKELIWTERAKELTQQRRAEELAARAAVLKEIANGQNIQTNYKHLSPKSESMLMDENRSPDQDLYQYVADERPSVSRSLGAGHRGRHGGASKGVMKGHSNGNNNSNHKSSSSMFSGNPSTTTNSGHVGRLLLPSMVTNSGHYEDSLARGSGPDRARDNGFAKTFPMRPSFFRERNRSLFKQPPSHPEYFRRDQRRLGFPSLHRSEEADPQAELTLDPLTRRLSTEELRRYFNQLLVTPSSDFLAPAKKDLGSENDVDSLSAADNAVGVDDDAEAEAGALMTIMPYAVDQTLQEQSDLYRLWAFVQEGERN